MNCPYCGRPNAMDALICQSCGRHMLAPQQGTRRRFTCEKCGKRLPIGAFAQGRTVCESCIQTHAAYIVQEKLKDEQRRRTFVSQTIAKHPELRPRIMQRLGLATFDGSFMVEYPAYQDIYAWHERITQAKNFELAKRHEDAAKIYESLGLWKEAGNAREAKTSRTVKHVTVNLNDLIDKLRTGGLSVPYKCGSCGASIVVNKDSSPDGLKFCSYCGSALNTDALLAMLQDALK